MKSNTIIESINKGLLVIGILLMLSTQAFAQNGNGNGNNGNGNNTNTEEPVEEAPIEEIAPIEAAAFAAPGGGGGGPLPPVAPNTTISETLNCGSTRLTRSSNPPAGIWWSWQNYINTPGSSGGTVGITGTNHDVTATGTYYLQAYDFGEDLWGEYISYSVTQVNSVPAIPASPSVQNNCGNSVVSYTSGQASGQNWHWQTSASGTTTDPVTSTLSKTFTSGSTIYVRAKSSAGCWSTARTVNYAIKSVPATPFDPTTNDTNCGSAFVEYDAIIANGKNWHWQTTASGTATDLVDNTLSRTFYSNGTIYVRAKNAEGCWSTEKRIDYNINAVPDLATGSTQSRCGDGSITLSAQPQGSGNSIKWYTAATGGSSFHTGQSYTFNLTTDVTYYAASYNSTTFCETTSRKAITADWKAIPALASGSGASRCGSGQLTISATPGSNGNEIKWYTAASGGSPFHTGGSYSPTLSTTTSYYAASHSTSTGCTDTDRVAVTATIDAIPASYNVTGGIQCSTAGTLTVGLDGSQSGMEYHLYYNYAPVLVEGTSTIVKVFGTGSAIDFTYDADQVGTYTVYAVNGSCSTLMTGDAKIVTAPLPVTVSGGGSFCPGLAGVPVNLSSAESGVTYELFRNGTTTGQTTTTASFGNQTLSGNYTVKASKGGCTIELAETIVVTTIAPPTIPVDSVSTNTCGDKIIYAIDPPHASTNVFWKWQGINSNGMSDDAFTSAGRVVDSTATYYVRAKDEGTGCWSSSKAINVTVIANPTQFVLYGGGDYCMGQASPALDLNASESDVVYKVYKDESYLSGQDQNGDAQGGALSWTGLTGGSYEIKGDRLGCVTHMYGTAAITEHLMPTANGGSDITVFNSDITMLPFSEINGSAWTSSEATIANNLYNARLDGPGTYNLTYTFTNTAGCSDDDDVLMTVVADPDRIELTAGSRFINTDPQASILAPTLTAPAGYTYQWYKDGAAMAGKTANTLQPDTVGVYDVEIMTASGFGVRSNAIAVVPLRATDNVNYITTRQLREAWTDENNLPIATDSVSKKLDFMDDLGRPMQTVIENQSVSGLDMVQPMAYDEFGRSPKAYLPYTSSVSVLFKNDAVDEQGTFYATTSGIAQDDFPYSENTFEASPLNRVLKTNAPGLAWAKTDTSEGKPVVFDFSANATGEVLKWEINSNALTRNGSYAAGVLSKTITTDENDKQVQEFKNLQGQVILKKVQVSETTPATDNDWYQTYYVYDEFNNLRYVLPPMAVQRYESEGQSADSGDQLVTATSNYEDLTTSSSAKMAYTSPALIHVNRGTTLQKGAEIYRVTAANATTTLNGDFLSKWAFQYRYDNRQRMVMKQVPGADSVLMVYDERDRLVMTQDGNQRANDQWSFTKYDELNRPVLTGIVVKTGSNRTTVQAEVDSLTGTGFYETYTGTGALMGYDGSGYPTTATANDLLTVTYYDNYGFTDDSHWTLGNFTTKPEARTLVTGSKVKVPGQTNWNEMITLYDTFFRVASSVSKDYQNNRDSLVNVYYSDVLPLVTKTTHIHVSALTNDTTTLVKDFVYDHADRLLSVTHKINDEAAVVILENEYNELGELTTKKLNKEGAGQYSQEVDYQYNIRGWLTKINDPGVSNPGDYFAMQLKYDEAGQYNGNIGTTSWKNPFEVATNSYAYGYDPVNRIKSAGYTTTASHGMDFDVNNITYDANGNIKTLQRTGNHDSQAAQLFDDLDYDYVGNQLTKVTDASGKDTGFKDGANATNEYVYDANGNMISDANKGIDSIAYNHLNLPIKVEMNADGSNRIEYIYDAAGVKMAQLVYGADTLTKRTDYQGAFIYEDSVLQFIQHEEGRVVPVIASGSEAISSYDYQYHLKDHLGNVRATFKTEIDTDTYLTTLESDSASVEELYFYNLDSVRVTYASANKTSLGDEAARVGQDSLHLVGPAIALSVVPGDTIDMEVWAYYEGGSGYSNTVAVNTFIHALATAFGGSSGAAGESGSIFDGINDALVGGAGGVGGNSDTNVPGAYLSYILFDQNYKEIQSGYHEISDAASFAHEKLFLNDITITQAGYLYIYTSMQSKGTQPVYFDDMKVTHTHSPIVQSSNFYPFGLTFSEYSRAAITAQNFKFHNQTEFINDLGLNWYHFKYRMHDPSLGRFFVIDPLAEEYVYNSTYAFAENKLGMGIELEGAELLPFPWLSTMSAFSRTPVTTASRIVRPVTETVVKTRVGKPKWNPNASVTENVKNITRTGRQAHAERQAQWETEGFKTEQTLGKGNRADGVKIEPGGKRGIIRELKPDSKNGRTNGLKQLERYVEGAMERFPDVQEWQPQLELYRTNGPVVPADATIQDVDRPLTDQELNENRQESLQKTVIDFCSENPDKCG